MNRLEVDLAVIGESLAGYAAALHLAQAGRHVVLLNFHRDTDWVDDLPFVQHTALGPRTRGLDFVRSVNERLQLAGVTRAESMYVTSIDCKEAVIVASTDSVLSAKGVVYAPNGTEPGVDWTVPFQGFGVSYSASHDAYFYKRRTVAVWGDSPRVFDHAYDCVAVCVSTPCHCKQDWTSAGCGNSQGFGKSAISVPRDGRRGSSREGKR